jgi:hypothetical protein
VIGRVTRDPKQRGRIFLERRENHPAIFGERPSSEATMYRTLEGKELGFNGKVASPRPSNSCWEAQVSATGLLISRCGVAIAHLCGLRDV